MDGYIFDDDAPAVTAYRNSPALLKLAGLYVAGSGPWEKDAIVPAGGDPSMGGQPMDPSGGQQPPPDPSAGGQPAPGGPPAPPDPSAGGGAPAAPVDPALIQAVAQAVMQQLGGGMGGAPGAPGGGMGMDMMGKPKKVDPAIIDAKLYDLDKKVSLICDQMGITIPASQTLGLPPDPMAASAAAQDNQNVSAAMGGGQPQGQGQQGPQGIQPMTGMDPSSGPIGKAASFGDTWPVERPADPSPYAPTASMAARFRSLMGAGR